MFSSHMIRSVANAVNEQTPLRTALLISVTFLCLHALGTTTTIFTCLDDMRLFVVSHLARAQVYAILQRSVRRNLVRFCSGMLHLTHKPIFFRSTGYQFSRRGLAQFRKVIVQLFSSEHLAVVCFIIADL